MAQIQELNHFRRTRRCARLWVDAELGEQLFAAVEGRPDAIAVILDAARHCDAAVQPHFVDTLRGGDIGEKVQRIVQGLRCRAQHFVQFVCFGGRL